MNIKEHIENMKSHGVDLDLITDKDIKIMEIIVNDNKTTDNSLINDIVLSIYHSDGEVEYFYNPQNNQNDLASKYSRLGNEYIRNNILKSSLPKAVLDSIDTEQLGKLVIKDGNYTDLIEEHDLAYRINKGND